MLVGIGLWRISRGDIYTSGSAFGYTLGVVGGLMMVGLLTYPLRKRTTALKEAGPLRHWFRAHMLLGILGPLFILFHSTLHIGSLNAAVAFGCMLLVAGSGIVGRFIYRQIHHGLYGARATVDELRADLDQQMSRLEPTFARITQVRAHVEAFMQRSNRVPATLSARTLHLLAMYIQRPMVWLRIRRALGAGLLPRRRNPDVALLASTVDEFLVAVHRHAEFSTYERLFSLWHVAHLPFVYMLAASAIVHVVAVHMY